jgi:hypothetical protein
MRPTFGMQPTFGWRLPAVYRFQVLLTVGFFVVFSIPLLTGRVLAPAWFRLSWLVALCWNGYWFLLRVVYQLEVRGGVLRWWAPLRSGQASDTTGPGVLAGSLGSPPSAACQPCGPSTLHVASHSATTPEP